MQSGKNETLTGVPASIVAQKLAKNPPKEYGVFALEGIFEPKEILNALINKGISFYELFLILCSNLVLFLHRLLLK